MCGRWCFDTCGCGRDAARSPRQAPIPPPALWLQTCMHAQTVQRLRTFSDKTGRGAGSCMEARGMTDKEQWVVWNGSLGVLDTVTIGLVEQGEGGRSACLAPPYGVVGPFSLDELEATGRIAFGACLVMSRERWQQDQVELRLKARNERQAFLSRLNVDDDDKEHREALDLPMDGALEPSEINAAFRRLAKSAHPDAGGSNERYRRIAEARDALLDQFAGAS